MTYVPREGLDSARTEGKKSPPGADNGIYRSNSGEASFSQALQMDQQRSVENRAQTSQLLILVRVWQGENQGKVFYLRIRNGIRVKKSDQMKEYFIPPPHPRYAKGMSVTSFLPGSNFHGSGYKSGLRCTSLNG